MINNPSRPTDLGDNPDGDSSWRLKMTKEDKTLGTGVGIPVDDKKLNEGEAARPPIGIDEKPELWATTVLPTVRSLEELVADSIKGKTAKPKSRD